MSQQRSTTATWHSDDRLVRFVLVGGFAAAVNWLSRFAFSQFLTLSLAVIAAFIVGMTTAFVLARWFVFDRSGRNLRDEYLRFALVNLVALLQVWIITLGLAKYLFPALGWHWHVEGVAHAIGILSPVLTSYFGHHYFTFAPTAVASTTTDAVTANDHRGSRSLPLVVELDRILLKTDPMLEIFVGSLLSRPLATFRVLPGLLSGRAGFKQRIAQVTDIDLARLPIRRDLLDYLIAEHQCGRKLHLVSAADQAIAQKIADQFGIFESVHGSTPPLNLKGRVKLKLLRELLPDGFVYAGDRSTDRDVWQHANAIVLANTNIGLAHRPRALGKAIEAAFPNSSNSLLSWRSALRIHQWSKNILIFVPFLLSPIHADVHAALKCVAAFLLMGMAASATYLCNDLADLAADRGHHSKRFRPLASGSISIGQALMGALTFLGVSIWGSLVLSPPFAAALVLYVITTLSYSLWLKRVALLDVIVLGGLYVMRLIMGTVVVALAFSPWLLTFAGFFFCSIALAKRHAEIVAASLPSDQTIAGRGYKPTDWPLTLSLGVSLSVASVLVIVEYLMAEAFPSGLYQAPRFLWAAPTILGAWVCRVWLLAHRGELHEDPVAFAVRDPVSLLLGGALGIAFVLALDS
jgi:4-hydroxybenzoate polyprenyltransferase/putative flippase GtrA